MSEHPPVVTSAFDAPVRELDGPPVFAPYDAPAGGWGALRATARALREQSIALKGSKTLLSMNQPDGFDFRVARGQTRAILAPSSFARTVRKPWLSS